MTSPMAGLLTLDQAAEYLGMCRSTFASVVQPYIALLVLTPRKIRVDPKELDRWLASKLQTPLEFLNDGLDSKTEYCFYTKRDWLYIWFYVGADRRQRACSLACPAVVDTVFRAEARARAQEIVASARTGRVVEASPDERLRVSSTIDEVVEAWKREQIKNYPSSFKTRHIQINNVNAVVTEVAKSLGLTPLQCILDDRGPQLFLDERMRQRDKETVKKEVGVMFHFLEWLKFHKYATELPPRPKYRPKDRGTRVGPQRDTPVHLPDEIALRIINELPEYAARGGRHSEETRRPDNAFVCRDWMRFSFEVSHRPSTVGRLAVPRHWTRGERYITITPDIDKGGNVAQRGKSRRVPLTKVAFDILMKRAPESGVIFGEHDIRVQWKRAAIKILGEEEGSRCAPYDLRHGANFDAVSELAIAIDEAAKQFRAGDEREAVWGLARAIEAGPWNPIVRFPPSAKDEKTVKSWLVRHYQGTAGSTRRAPPGKLSTLDIVRELTPGSNAARGEARGRPPRMTAAQRDTAMRMRDEGRTTREIAAAIGVPKSTVGRVLAA